MTTRIKGEQYIDQSFDPDRPKLTPKTVDEELIGELGGHYRVDIHESHKMFFLDDVLAVLEVHNSRTKGVEIIHTGPRKDEIVFTHKGKPFQPPTGYFETNLPLEAHLPERGRIHISWKPQEPFV